MKVLIRLLMRLTMVVTVALLVASCGGAPPVSSPASASQASPVASPAPASLPADVAASPSVASRPAAVKAAASSIASQPASKPASAAPASAGGAAGPATSGAVKIAWTQPAAAYAPLWLAQDQGYFKKYGLDTDSIHLAPPSDTQALISGDVQMVIGGTGGISAIAGGANLTFVGVTVPVYLQSLFGQASIQKVSDLAGKQVAATTQGGPSDFALRTVLKREGVDPATVKIVYLRDDTTILASLESGSVQAAIVTSPNTLRARKAGLRQIEDLIPLKLHTVTQGIYVRKDWAQQHQDTLESILKGYLEAVRDARSKPDLAKSTISKWTKVDDPALLEESYKTTISGLAAYPLVHHQDIQNVIDLSPDPKLKTHKPADFYDNAYLQKLDGFVKSLYPGGVPEL